MPTIYLEIEQNGGEYMGWCKVESRLDQIAIIDTHTVLIDGVKLTFDERVSIIKRNE